MQISSFNSMRAAWDGGAAAEPMLLLWSVARVDGAFVMTSAWLEGETPCSS